MSQQRIIQGRHGSASGNFADARIDASTFSIQTIDYAHHEIHGGSSYHLELTTAALGDETNDHLQISFTTPNTAKWIHMIAAAYGSGQYNYSVREAPTAAPVGGDAVVPRNRNRNSADASTTVTPISGGSAATGGTLLINHDLGSGNARAGESRDNQEWVLKQDTMYVFRLYATSGIQAVLSLDWYEHTDKA